MENEDNGFEEAYREAIRVDLGNINSAMDGLIDSVSRFKAVQSVDDLGPDDFANMITHLDYAKFIISGVMYLHGMPICGHDDHDEDDNE